MAASPFPSVPDGAPVVLSAAVYRRIVAMLLSLADPQITGARQVNVDGNGRLTMQVDPGGGTAVVLAKITGTVDTDGGSGSSGSGHSLPGLSSGDTLSGGVYTGYVLSPDGVFGLDDPETSTSTVYLLNMREVGGGHALDIGSYCWGLPNGTAADGNPVYTLMQMDPLPTQLYQVRTPVDATLTPIWTSVRFCGEGGTPSGSGGSGGSGT
jgi:hypothetical protein